MLNRTLNTFFFISILHPFTLFCILTFTSRFWSLLLFMFCFKLFFILFFPLPPRITLCLYLFPFTKTENYSIYLPYISVLFNKQQEGPSLFPICFLLQPKHLSNTASITTSCWQQFKQFSSITKMFFSLRSPYSCHFVT